MSNSIAKLPRAGWSGAETEQLFSLAAAAQAENRPLKGVFEQVASATNRRPNSVRNYYYARVREEAAPATGHRRAFQPFSDAESARLVEEVLRAQARGESVRACTLRLAGGNDTAMLRYQNKYRALLKNHPAFVQRIMTDMEKCGEKAFNPFLPEENVRRVGRPRKQSRENLQKLCERVTAHLSRVEGLQASVLLEALDALALAAGSSGVPAGETAQTESVEQLSRQLAKERARGDMLLTYLKTLLQVNSNFLSRNAGAGDSNLSEYIRDLESSVRRCQPLMAEG